MTPQTLSLPQCREYIWNIKELEVSCYEQELLIKQLEKQPSIVQQRIDELQHRLKTEQEPDKPLSTIGSIITALLSSIITALYFSAYGGFGGIIVRILAAIFSSRIRMFSSPWLPYIIWGAVIVFVPAFIFVFISLVKDNIDNRATYSARLETFHRKQEATRNLIEAKKQSGTSLAREIEKSKQTYQETKTILQKYYDRGFIYPKYRGLVPISTICEYLESGRCFSLLGPDGAYNLYESELRMNLIIGKLDTVIDRLDEISSNQRMLVQEIRQCNAQVTSLLSTISDSLDRIEGNTALTQYYSSVTASNTTYLTWVSSLMYDEQRKQG